MKKELLLDIKSGDQEKVIATVKELRKSGTNESLPILIELLATTENQNVYNEILSLLFDLKTKGAEEILIQAISENRFAKEREVLVSVFWQSSLDASPYVNFFVDLALKEEYMTAFECLTVIESISKPENLNEEEILDAIRQLNEAISRENKNKKILVSMLEVLNDYLIG